MLAMACEIYYEALKGAVASEADLPSLPLYGLLGLCISSALVRYLYLILAVTCLFNMTASESESKRS